jgi:hypothetical protein
VLKTNELLAFSLSENGEESLESRIHQMGDYAVISAGFDSHKNNHPE